MNGCITKGMDVQLDQWSFKLFLFFLLSCTHTHSRSPSPYSEKLGEEGVRRKRARSPSDTGGPLDSGRDGSPGQGEEKDGSSKEWSSLLDSFNTLFEPFSPDHSPEHSFDLYDDDIPPTKRVSGCGLF